MRDHWIILRPYTYTTILRILAMEEAPEQLSEEELKRAQAAVTDLCDFSARYFEHHSVDQAGQKAQDVEKKMKETISLLDSVQDSLPKIQYWNLKGRALNVSPEHSKEAEDCLSRAVKHDPTLVEAWNALGENYWKAGNVQQAHDCFMGSLAHVKSKESLRNLSMVLRQLGKDPAEKEEKMKESVEKAKEAVALDVKDGTSWMVLGNAYLSLFFTTDQDPKLLKQCFSAYVQAEKDPISANNPDYHYNKATLCQYEEEYLGMLRELSLASSLEPGWGAPRERMDTIWKYLKSMEHLVSTKGKVRAKVLTTITSKLTQTEKYVSEIYTNKSPVLTSALQEGLNQGKVLIAAVTASVPSKEKVPYASVVVDYSGECIGLTVYNLAESFTFAQGDVITIPDPCLRRTAVNHNGELVEFSSVRVTKPNLLLLNGQKLPPDKLAPSTIAIKTFT